MSPERTWKAAYPVVGHISPKTWVWFICNHFRRIWTAHLGLPCAFIISEIFWFSHRCLLGMFVPSDKGQVAVFLNAMDGIPDRILSGNNIWQQLVSAYRTRRKSPKMEFPSLPLPSNRTVALANSFKCVTAVNDREQSSSKFLEPKSDVTTWVCNHDEDLECARCSLTTCFALTHTKQANTVENVTSFHHFGPETRRSRIAEIEISLTAANFQNPARVMTRTVISERLKGNCCVVPLRARICDQDFWRSCCLFVARYDALTRTPGLSSTEAGPPLVICY